MKNNHKKARIDLNNKVYTAKISAKNIYEPLFSHKPTIFDELTKFTN